MSFDLFDEEQLQQPLGNLRVAEQALVLRGFALPWVEQVLPALRAVLAQSPFRTLQTPGGLSLSVRTSSCGTLGWISDQAGYRYTSIDPLTATAWPSMPAELLSLASAAAQAAGFADFVPDTCLINTYVPGARMALHQDRNERAFDAPVVSLSLGLPAIFQLGGYQRSDPVQRISLFHGDMLVWGGVDRLRFHAVLPIKPGMHPLLGARRLNITWRKAG